MRKFSQSEGPAQWRGNVFNSCFRWCLVMQTRLKPYLDAVELVIDETGIRFDATGLAAMFEARRGGDERNALIALWTQDWRNRLASNSHSYAKAA